MTTSFDCEKSFATSSHRSTPRAPKSRAAEGIHQTVLTAGICMASESKRTLEEGRGGRRKGALSDPQSRMHPRTHIPYSILYDTT